MKPDDVDLDVRGPQQPTDKRSGVSGSDATIVAAVCLMYPPIASNLWFGQSEVFLCLFLALMLLTRC
jgi:hypothetical protein